VLASATPVIRQSSYLISYLEIWAALVDPEPKSTGETPRGYIVISSMV